MYEFKMPDLGEGIHEGEILKWHVEEGGEVKEDAPLVDVETDKAAVTIPSPRGGKVISVKGKVGDTVNVGDVITVIDDGSAPAAQVAAPAEETAAPVKETAPAEETAPVNGSALYAELCAVCHAADGTGGIGPDLTGEYAYGRTPEAITASIADGRPGGMPGFASQLSAAEIGALVNHLTSL